ncbi:MAG: envelope stress response membrane protein PspC [Gammaproteobacteria bacterium]|nr:envelope stress response membrane protein PspC [Gammaproteobacteria bacterium]
MRDEYDEPLMPRRLYRDSKNGIICGVCAGIAEYFGFDRTITRVVTAVSLIFFMPGVLLIYFGLCFLLPRKPAELERPDQDARFAQAVRFSPQDTLSNVRYKFRDMEARMRRMERYVTSPRYKLDEEFRDLEDRGA